MSRVRSLFSLTCCYNVVHIVGSKGVKGFEGVGEAAGTGERPQCEETGPAHHALHASACARAGQGESAASPTGPGQALQ